MVWESGCVVIVMLTPLSENGVRQCYHYWPDEGSNLYHIYEVLPGRSPGRGQGALAAAGGGPVLGRHWAAVPASPQEVCPALRSAGPPDSCATGTLPEMVHLVSEHIWCEDFLVRSFYLKNLQTNETRTVTQFHFLSWYDQGVPSSTRSLLDFRR
ncbi:hypothetical protein Celaphus_00012457 [Cervus elaphus hippelaphus]|uniref:Tyrosine-protein phosphatase domain-containing protein n=1 Tax=Cervus elaphus hippelaphus TaxID=46360 RepID=A0A212CL41_CEREH|nr:hypothetical protein Celaphus_00012457 [Cervus elaphus hippelaphus]